MAQKKITDLTLRSDFDATCNVPVDDSTQTKRVTGGQMRDFIKELRVTTKTANYTTTDNDDLVKCNAVGGAFTITLHTPTAPSKVLRIKKTDSSLNAVALSGFTHSLLIQNEVITLFYNGATWELLDLEYNKCVAVYASDAGQSISNGGSAAIVDFEDMIIDNYSAVTIGASWKFEAPRAAKYRISVFVTWNTAAWLATEYQSLIIYKNGVSDKILSRSSVHANVSTYMESKGSYLMNLAAGDEINILAAHIAAGGNRALISDASYVYVTIEEI